MQTLARVLDSNSSSLASLTADSLGDVNRLADHAARCQTAIGALDGLCKVILHFEILFYLPHARRREHLGDDPRRTLRPPAVK